MKFLQRKGYRVLERNYRTEYGEVDMIARLGNRTIFVEVKTRTTDRFGQPETGVTPRKQETLIACSEAFFEAHPHLVGDWQIDVVAILLLPNKSPQITHFENAVTG